MENQISKLLSRVSGKADFIDLMDTNFLSSGIIFPSNLLERESIKYFKNRTYQPDPKGLVTARRAISGYYSWAGLTIQPNEILITASTSESYNLLFNTFTKPGDNVLLPKPCYPLFEYLARFNHLKVRFYSSFEEIAKKVNERTKFIVVISPNNPTGAVYSDEELIAVAEVASERNIMVISDEVFSEFVYDLPRLSRIAGIKQKRPTVFTLNGISKMFALPDLKLAWIGVSGDERVVPELVDQLETNNDVFLNANYLTQSILPALFENRESQKFVKDMVAKVKQRRDALVLALDIENERAGKPIFKVDIPAGGIHCWINLPDVKLSEEEFVLKLLQEQHVNAHPGYFYDCEAGAGKGVNIAISFLASEQNLVDGIARLAEQCRRNRS